MLLAYGNEWIKIVWVCAIGWLKAPSKRGSMIHGSLPSCLARLMDPSFHHLKETHTNHMIMQSWVTPVKSLHSSFLIIPLSPRLATLHMIFSVVFNVVRLPIVENKVWCHSLHLNNICDEILSWMSDFWMSDDTCDALNL
jgi:hypothetical protein